MPFVDKTIIINQIEYFSLCTADAVIPRVNSYDEPLHAIYRNSIYGQLDNYLSSRKEYAIRDFLANVNVNYLQLSASEQTGKAFANINTPSEADEAIRLSGIC